ncbi:MAG: alpha/beta hydrolase [Pseudomonadota bacterium]
MAACSTRAQLAVVNVTALNFDGAIYQDEVFAPELDLAADIYTPATDAPHDVVIFIYGGGWRTGEKAFYQFVGVTLAKEGFIAVIPDYRKYPDVRHPDFVDDAAKAVAWVHANIEDFGGNPDRIYLSGHSAGAHIAGLLSADERYLRDVGADGVIKGFAGLAGPYHFNPEAPELVEIFGPPERYPDMQVSTFIDGSEPPMMLLHGLQDTIVGRINVDRLSKIMTGADACHAVRFYDDLGHDGIIAGFTWVFRGSRTVVDDVANYFRAISAGETCPAPSG